MPLDLWLGWKAATGGAKGSDDLPANAWDKMAPAEVDYSGQFGDVRDLYESAYGKASSYTPSATAAQVAPTVLARDDLYPRNYQQSNAALLADIAAGKGGGVAEAAARSSLASSMATNNAFAARARGNALAGAARTVGSTNAGMAVGAEAKIAQLKAQERLAAEMGLTPQLAGMRSQDFGAAATQARLDATTGMANAGFKTQTGLARDDAALKGQQAAQYAFSALAGHDRQQQANAIAAEKRKAGMADWEDELAWERQSRNNATLGQGLQNMGTLTQTGVSSAARQGGTASSDRNRKTNVQKAPEDEFRELMAAYAADAWGGR